ncbi:MAG: ABC transporter ATP-binding protein [Roseiflexaceae bacterium]|nr:ABC transporter ATP-binding protein [Roseiflexaceae bacterium]
MQVSTTGSLATRSEMTAIDAQASVISANNVEHVFSEGVGVFDLNFEIPPGTIFGMIGPSGCGKTTTVRLLTGLYRPDHGKLMVLKQAPINFSSRTRTQIGYMPQHFVLYPNLTVWENLNFVASLYGMGYLKRRRPLNDALEFVELSHARNRLSSQLSGGMQRRLQLACMLVNSPQLMFADEPTAGVDPVLRAKFWEHFRSLRDQGKTLFVTTQYVGEAAYCDLIAVMRAGRIIHLDTPANLQRKALGGEIIKLVVNPADVPAVIQICYQHPAINDVRRSNREPGLLYLQVEDAAATLPLLFGVLGQHPEITVQQAEKYAPPFDDIFIQLMEQAEGEDHV